MSERPSAALPGGTNPFYASLVDRSVSGMIDAVGAADIEAVLMIGAPARGETTVVSTPDGPYSLSDIDLACLSKPEADVPALRRRLAAWVTAWNKELAGSCAGLDASVRQAAQMAAPPPLITTFEMLRSPAVLWGDLDVARRLGAMAVQDVPRWDSLVLFHNRVVEQALLSEGERTPQSRDFRAAAARLYTSGKFLLDAVTALLYLERNVPRTYAERFEAFAGGVLEARGRERLKSAMEPWLDDIETWARFKTSGDLSTLRALRGARAGNASPADRARMGGPAPAGTVADHEDRPPDAIELDAMAAGCWQEYTKCAEPLWRAALGEVTGSDAMELELPGLAALYSRLESRARKAVRALRMLRSPAGRSGLFSTARVFALAPFASPRQLSYLTATLCYLSVGDTFDDQVVSRLVAKYCPFSVPGAFARMTMAEKRAALADRFRLFHHSVLRGREIPADR